MIYGSDIDGWPRIPSWAVRGATVSCDGIAKKFVMSAKTGKNGIVAELSVDDNGNINLYNGSPVLHFTAGNVLVNIPTLKEIARNIFRHFRGKL